MPTFIEYYFPGSVVTNKSSVSTDTRELGKIDLPANAFGLRFYDAAQVDGNRSNTSKLYLLAEEILDQEGVSQKIPDNDILLSNMRINGYKYIACTRRGSCHFVDENTIVVNADKEIVHGSDGINRISAQAVEKSLVTSEPVAVRQPLKFKPKGP